MTNRSERIEAGMKARRDAREVRHEAKVTLEELCDLHFKTSNSTMTPEQREGHAVSFMYQLEELRSILDSMEQSVDA